MEQLQNNSSDPICQDPTPSERERLVRYCSRFTGDPHAAEDLAQQTLLEAWRRARTLRDPRARQGWLFGIARNLCLMWARARTREVSRLASLDEGRWEPPALAGRLADDFDLAVELEREDLARLLDRALALLPPGTRRVLVERYIEESPQAEIAERLGLTEGAVEARLHRGKLTLRRVLSTELRDEAIAHGLAAGGNGWQETRVWCPMCGGHRLLGLFDGSGGELHLHCPGCDEPSVFSTMAEPGLFEGVRGYKPALSRVLASAHDWLLPALPARVAPCPRCGGLSRLRTGPSTPASRLLTHVLYRACDSCGTAESALQGIALLLPETRRFWREHPRMRVLPVREVETGGVPVLVAGFESVTQRAGLAVLCARDTFEIVAVHATPDG